MRKPEQLHVEHIRVSVCLNQIIIMVDCRDAYEAQVAFEDVHETLARGGSVTLKNFSKPLKERSS